MRHPLVVTCEKAHVRAQAEARRPVLWPGDEPRSGVSRMIGTDTISRVIGQDVYDSSGDEIGSAVEVYLDDETGHPEWVTVRTGLFGTEESFVPIRNPTSPTTASAYPSPRPR